ncbi:hypothetical protein ADU59_21980 [Pararhizobium polonicum]|uniref:VOC domain-containing protein n=1 Tax=Pararhizobium polonicum TaxID=1612624 RepID=A0A1C7P1G5_9HYPH|nr:VOC family protein [Pararhizobium polonicum]OBZ93514.1 hypothetical protein ADU59_21980 [Pararhizobium polonicum]
MTKNEPLINQAVTWLYTEELEKLVPFYRDVMELPLVLEQARCRVFRMAAGAFIGVCRIPERPLGTKGMMVTFLTADVQALYERLLAKGVEFEHPPKPLGDGSLIGTFFRDPQGYHLQIQQFLDPRWPAAEMIV